MQSEMWCLGAVNRHHSMRKHEEESANECKRFTENDETGQSLHFTKTNLKLPPSIQLLPYLSIIRIKAAENTVRPKKI